jgi:hypothetical protein
VSSSTAHIAFWLMHYPCAGPTAVRTPERDVSAPGGGVATAPRSERTDDHPLATQLGLLFRKMYVARQLLVPLISLCLPTQ